MSMKPVKFHVSLNVADVARSVDFYRKLLGLEPAKQMSDYAKFELEAPPLVLSLIHGRLNPGGTLNHIGMRQPNPESLFALQARLETVSIQTRREEGVQCCHSTQTKFWVNDPDRTVWEFYILCGDDSEAHDHSTSMAEVETQEPGLEEITWQHQIPEPFPTRIPQGDSSVHHVTLEGTANMKAPASNLSGVLAEACRVLRPGGVIALHGLAGDKPFKHSNPHLPGPAALVEYVPTEAEPMEAMIEAGFVEVRFERLSPAPHFLVNGVQMREILLVGRKPGHRPRSANHQAMYLGPLAQVTDDFGNVFPRGKRVFLNIHDWQVLSQGNAANHFLLLPPDTTAVRQES